VIEKAIHGFAPGPEIVARGASSFCQPRERALETMAVHIAQTRQCDALALLAARFDAALDACNVSPGELHEHAVAPTIAQQRGLEP
jgi:hypothetical protein